MSGFQFRTKSSSTTSPFSFASSSPPPPPSPFSNSSFGFGFANTTNSSPFTAPSAPPASHAPVSSTLFGTSATGNATTSLPSGGSTLFGSSSGTDPILNLFGSSSGSGNSSNLFGASFGNVNTSTLFNTNSGSGNSSSLFGSRMSTASCPSSSIPNLFGTSSSIKPCSSSTSPSIPNLFGTSSSIKPCSSSTYQSQSSPLLSSTVTTTSVASTPTTTTTTALSAASTPAILDFGVTASIQDKDGSVAGTESFPCFVTSDSAVACNITCSVSGFSPSTDATGTAGASQPQTSVVSTLLNLSNEKEVNLGLSEGEIKQLKDIIRFLSIRMTEYQDKDPLQSPLLYTEGELAMVPVKFLEGPGAKIEEPFVTSQLTDNSKFLLSPQNNLIIKQIFDKYGDITSGCILKSTVAKSMFLSLVANVVERLGNHTLQTLSTDELKLMEMELADAEAVGFDVDWLRHRVDQVIAASVGAKRVDELEILIFAAKRSVMELELQQLIWKKEISDLKVELKGGDLSESDLVEGLL